MLNDDMVRLAKETPGDLVPKSSYYGIVDGADPPLLSTPCSTYEAHLTLMS